MTQAEILNLKYPFLNTLYTWSKLLVVKEILTRDREVYIFFDGSAIIFTVDNPGTITGATVLKQFDSV